MTVIIGEIIGNMLLIIGSLFLFSAGLGVLRMPDTYNRIQTGTKATTLGTILVLVLAIGGVVWWGLPFCILPGHSN